MRLEAIEPHLAGKIRTSDSGRQRKIVLLACQFAMNVAPVGNAVVTQALSALEHDQRFTVEQIAELNRLLQELDERYFDLQDEADDDAEKQIEALHCFGQARTVSALLCGQDPDPMVASMEVVYEASATTDKPVDLFDAAIQRLAGP